MIKSHDFVNAVLSNGGISIGRVSGAPISFDDGYIVSFPVPIAIIPEMPDLDKLDRWIPSWIEIVRRMSPGAFLGAWRDEKGYLFIDGNRWYPDKDEALAAGKANNQIAIFDCAAGDSIYLK